jgi:hypothetical protein
LGYVVKNLEEAQEEFFQYTKNVRPKNREGEGEAPESPEAAGGEKNRDYHGE